ncbi:hypothetical protein [Schaalia sp. ZJ1691]|uniref:hypothetical protein n=1 Tax=Schaalia sp. ZJ1691 TaxID=2709404 RepID=UPI0013EA5048|nr:hypothetical protein [Schaalia sp. ZJ1691]
MMEILEEIHAHAAAALDGLGVRVTSDPVEATTALQAGAAALLILPSPSITWKTATWRTLEWTLWALAPSRDLQDAAATLEAILDALGPTLLPSEARAQSYDIGSETIAGYEITLTTETTA